MKVINTFVIICLIVTLFYFIGLLTFVTDHEENKCDMTYMFEYPQFVKINVPIEQHLPRYGLYAYSEGKLTEKARSMKFTGIPVIFVPGNAGSYKQGRSLASVALRKALNSRPGYHFDFFTVDLNGELSGLNGAVLQEQVIFLNHSIFKVLDLYDRSKLNHPKSVILIGHSMGGVIAHNIFTNSGNTRHVQLLITLASPHKRPSVCLDGYIADFYDQIEQNILNSGNSLKNKTFISIGGGFYDHLVNTGLTNINATSLNVATTGVPTGWLSVDHPCIVWCKQIVLAITRALFDSVDLSTKQLSSNSNYRLSVFKHHLIKNSGTNIRWRDRYRILVKLDVRGDWREDIRRQYTVVLPKGTSNSQWHMVRLINDPKHQALFVQAVNLAITDWIFACTANAVRQNIRYCENGIHLSHLTNIAPTANLKRRTYFVNLSRLKKRYPHITHIAVKILPTSEPVFLQFDIHNPNDRSISVNLPRWFSFSRTIIIPQTIPESIRYEIILNGFQHVLQSYLLYVEPIECTEATHHATVSLSVPWVNHDLHQYITESSKKPLPIRLHSSRLQHQSNLTAKVILTLDPTCQYKISISNSFIGMLGQFARYYSPMIVANMAAVILMVYRSQLNSIYEHGYCSLFQASLSVDTKPYYLITCAKLVSKVLPNVRILGITFSPDAQVLAGENIDFFLLPLFLYVTAVGLTYLISLILWACIFANESTIHKIVGRIFTRTIGGTLRMSEWAVNAMHRVPCIVAASLVCLGSITCGSLGLALGVVYYFLKLTQLCQDCLEGLAYGYLKRFIFGTALKIFKRKEKKESDNNALELIKKTDSSETEETDENVDALENIDKSLSVIQNEIKDISENEPSVENKLDEEIIDEKSRKLETVNNDNLATISKDIVQNIDKPKDIENVDDNKDIKDSDSEGDVKDIDDKNKDIKNVIGENEESVEENVDDSKIANKNSLELESVNNEMTIRQRKLVVNTNNDEDNQLATIPKNANKKKNPVIKIKMSTDDNDNSEIHFHFTLFLLWIMVTIINIPSVLTWAHNFQYNNNLRPDPSEMCGFIMCLCAIPLWQLELPRVNKKYYRELSFFVNFMALMCLVYAPLNIYRLSHILTTTLVGTMVHQLFAPILTEEEKREEPEHFVLDPIQILKDIKSKWE